MRNRQFRTKGGTDTQDHNDSAIPFTGEYTCIERCDDWVLIVAGEHVYTLTTQSGSSLITTAHPHSLRTAGETYECTVTEVISAYIDHSDTHSNESDLYPSVRETLS